MVMNHDTLIICTVGHSSTSKVVVDGFVAAMPLVYLCIYSLFNNAVDNTNHVVSGGWILMKNELIGKDVERIIGVPSEI
jgi:hypothetical protein